VLIDQSEGLAGLTAIPCLTIEGCVLSSGLFDLDLSV